MSDSPHIAAEEVFLRRPDVERMTGLSCAMIYRLIERGEFPASKKYICASGVFWLLSEIRAWQQSQLEAA